MSIITKKGDDGSTGLMYNRRVSKCHPRVEAYGTVDELNSSLGLARAATADPFIQNELLKIQKELVILMGELATAESDLERYSKDGYERISADRTRRLETIARELEGKNIRYEGWATPGANQASACLDIARTVCRRAERRVCGLHEAGELNNPEVMIYLNRLSDLLWLLARWLETASLC